LRDPLRSPVLRPAVPYTELRPVLPFHTPGTTAWLRSWLSSSRPWAVLSASCGEFTERENAARNALLYADLAFASVPYLIHAEGVYNGETEQSLIALGISEEDALQHARRFAQESILSPRGLVYTDGRGAHPTLRLRFELSQDSDRTLAVCTDGTLAFVADLDFATLRQAVSL
jgi:hypothetical protein